MTADERRALKDLVDARIREGLGVREDPVIPKRPSNNPQGKQSFLTEDDVQRLYRMYQATSLDYVARLVWKHYGYRNHNSCKQSLRKAFKQRDLTLHAPSTGWERRRAIAEYEAA